jgi:hypothetical protein
MCLTRHSAICHDHTSRRGRYHVISEVLDGRRICENTRYLSPDRLRSDSMLKRSSSVEGRDRRYQIIRSDRAGYLAHEKRGSWMTNNSAEDLSDLPRPTPPRDADDIGFCHVCTHV